MCTTRSTAVPSARQAALLCCVVPEPWHRLPRGCGVFSLGISQSRLDMALGTLLWVSLLGQGLEQRDPEGPASLSCAAVL